MDHAALATLERTLTRCIAVAVEIGDGDPQAERTLRLARAFLASAYEEVISLQRRDRVLEHRSP